ncbi:hypothetical protein ACQU0X_28800 [Pseudovibrio ascidiaceicola]|uniref:hypothetical protein n=1 Tax=Pseudovibrio ascidiaceicola TaxID=285279 RepID=UPI003D3689AC
MIFTRKYKGLVHPELARTYDEARDVYQRKGIWMVRYIRARRSKDRLKGYFRKMHLGR